MTKDNLECRNIIAWDINICKVNKVKVIRTFTFILKTNIMVKRREGIRL